jgi:sugar phosphate isomerase/epimerase
MGNTDILSIQLYTLRSLGDLERVLDTVQHAGYGHVETIGSHLEKAENVRAKLDARGLKVSSSHVSLPAVRERPDQVVQACHTLGFDQLFMPAVPSEDREKDASYWRALGHELGEIALGCASTGSLSATTTTIGNSHRKMERRLRWS